MNEGLTPGELLQELQSGGSSISLCTTLRQSRRLKKSGAGGGESVKTWGWGSRVLRQDGEVTTTGRAKGREERQG